MKSQTNYIYVDFSPANVGFKKINHKYKYYLFDFGEIIKIGSNFPINMTPRYASRNTLESKIHSIEDDFEAFGFLLLEIHYGYKKTPIPKKTSVNDKYKLINDSINGDYGIFFKTYFSNYNNSNLFDSINNLEKQYLDLN